MLTKKEAIEKAESGEWKVLTPEARVRMQIYEDFLCMPFNIYHEALEKVLGRPVYTHELADSEKLRKEYEMHNETIRFACESIIRDTLWMARRYADGRNTYAVSMYNRAARAAKTLGIIEDKDMPDGYWALDGSGPEYDGLTKEERKEYKWTLS